MPTITKEQVLIAATGAKTITEVARKLGILKGKLSGHTAKLIRAACPDLEDLLKAKTNDKPNPSTESTFPKTKTGKLSPNLPNLPDPENPYRPGSTYAVLFQEGSKRFMTKAELIEKVASLTGKSASCISFSLSVLCHKAHSSNNGRSMALRGEGGTIKLVAIRRH